MILKHYDATNIGSICWIPA